MTRLLILFVLVTHTVFSQTEYARYVVKTLCSPTFEGRGYVNGGDSMAAHFIAHQFDSLGIKPLNDSYFQPFSFEVNSFPNTMEVTLNGKALRAGIDFMVDPASGGGAFTLKTRTISLQDIFSEQFEKVLDSCKTGKLLPVFSPLTSTNKDTLSAWRALQNQLAENVCPVIVIQTNKFTWSVDQNQYKYPLVFVQDSMFEQGQVTLSINAKLYQHNTQNIIACLPAQKKEKKRIVLTAHYDHLGRMGSNAYFPGGNDNASGIGMLLSLAKALGRKSASTTCIFIAFAGEEAGLLGSHYYVQNPLFPLKNIDFLLNLDIMGSGEDGITVVNATLFPKQFKQLDAINEKEHLVKVIKKRGAAANSDHYWFSENKVPSFFIYTMGPNKNYHDVYDTYEALSFAAFASIRDLVLRFLLVVK